MFSVSCQGEKKLWPSCEEDGEFAASGSVKSEVSGSAGRQGSAASLYLQSPCRAPWLCHGSWSRQVAADDSFFTGAIMMASVFILCSKGINHSKWASPLSWSLLGYFCPALNIYPAHPVPGAGIPAWSRWHWRHRGSSGVLWALVGSSAPLLAARADLQSVRVNGHGFNGGFGDTEVTHPGLGCTWAPGHRSDSQLAQKQKVNFTQVNTEMQFYLHAQAVCFHRIGTSQKWLHKSEELQYEHPLELFHFSFQCQALFS